MKRWPVPLLIAVVMVLCMLPSFALAVSHEDEFDIEAEGFYVQSEDAVTYGGEAGEMLPIEVLPDDDETPAPSNLASVATIAKIANKTYTGKQIKPEPVVTLKSGGTKLVKGTDYTVTYGANKNAGTGTVTVTGKGSYTGSITAKFTIAKAANKATKVTSKKTLKASKLAEKKQSFKISATVKGKAKKSFKLVSVPKKAKKYVSVSKGGKVVVKKGLGKGTYKIKVKITAGATANYKKTTVAKYIKVVVK